MNTVNVLGVPIAAINMGQAADEIEKWIQSGQQKYVRVTGVHGIMEAQYDEKVRLDFPRFCRHPSGRC